MVAGEGALSLLELVPDVLCVDGQSVAATTWLAPLLTAMEHEVAGGSPGVSAIQSKVADVFVSQALRSWLVGAERTGLLPAAVLSNDETIMCAIDAIENNLGGKWTIDKLASTAGLSRTAFVTRFRRVVGDSPMHYVSRLRVSAAAGLLTTSRLSLHEVAIATGYDSDASLSKAFRRQLGVAPGAYRAAARQPAISVEPASVGRAADESSRGAAGGGTERPTSRSDP
jgi:transcriptional regulator GlxA family with amidase domain